MAVRHDTAASLCPGNGGTTQPVPKKRSVKQLACGLAPAAAGMARDRKEQARQCHNAPALSVPKDARGQNHRRQNESYQHKIAKKLTALAKQDRRLWLAGLLASEPLAAASCAVWHRPKLPATAKIMDRPAPGRAGAAKTAPLGSPAFRWPGGRGGEVTSTRSVSHRAGPNETSQQPCCSVSHTLILTFGTPRARLSRTPVRQSHGHPPRQVTHPPPRPHRRPARAPSHAVVGYARTSTLEQAAGLEAQLRDLQAAGCKSGSRY